MKNKSKNAISLIVLVITIIVLSILAATVIVSLSNTNIISQASTTTFKSDMSSYKEIYEMYVINELAKDTEFDRDSLNLTYQDEEFFNIFGDVSDRYKEGLRIEEGRLVYESADETENELLASIGMKPKYVSKTQSYVGYFADTDGNGTVDGVIFADMCIGGTAGDYGTIPKYDADTVKDYEISQQSYNVPGAAGYGAHPVLVASGTGSRRFYVMALEDEGYYSWYESAGVWGIYSLASPHLAPENSKNFDSGWSNTSSMQSLWSERAYGYGAEESDEDIWKISKLSSGWFVPSLGEWLAFVSNIISKGGEQDVRTFFALNPSYWTSSLDGTIVPNGGNSMGLKQAYQGAFYNNWSYAHMEMTQDIDSGANVRLARIF